MSGQVFLDNSPPRRRAKRPHWIWADDGETPYYYVEGEEIPASAGKYVNAKSHETVLRQLGRARAALADLLPVAKHHGGLRDSDVAAIKRAECLLNLPGIPDSST